MSADQLLKQQIIEKAWSDPVFKQQLLNNPKQAIQDAFGVQIPNEIELKAVEETQTEFYLVIPPNPADTLNSGDPADNAAW
ncbi:NHLP leader peptide family RiPP precursor [Paenibacillus ginsengarvi]|uniref:NHLP leader peptide family natural product n=1 Tax=Paenibacillus ginsengarvi TaxID=400777 RepID=A0A3B0CGK8_9BACL|nr:NHLP leader peptide family RiPP precursor [Paenibacillus ginsengarvi]RKN84131.1 NHLP leader peptide family natural product precursor [Paenibacillus ginsengarvi]